MRYANALGFIKGVLVVHIKQTWFTNLVHFYDHANCQYP